MRHQAGPVRPTILIADPESAVTDMLTAALEPAGYATVTASTLEHALAILSAQAVDGILVNTFVPRWSDAALAPARELRKAAPGVPVILISPDLEAAELDPHHEGLAGILTKPFAVPDLLLLLQQLGL